jgi:DNA-binding winged helix-turn-helix (wHTH) protein/TolB-like protein/cytochrome c-type biogenesis protein CcmH/NrfG
MKGISPPPLHPASGFDRGRTLGIGEWRVDPAANRISRNGEEAHLEPKAMDVLLLLAVRAGEVVSREELLATVWSGNVVCDDTLTQAVIKLRKALGDDSRSPAYIETISKRGYRLVAEVRVEMPGTDGANDSADSAPPPAPHVRSRRHAWLAGLALLISVLGALLVFSAQQKLRNEAELPAPPLLEASALESLPTLTVLPFESLGEQAPDYLARGIAADLATDLARLGELRVIRAPLEMETASMASGRGLARYIVSGSVQRGARLIRINVWLLDSASGRQLWSERYERPLNDLIAIQEEIVEQLAGALPVHVSDAERRRMASRHTRNLQAYDLFLQAYAARITHLPDENIQARELYRQAVALDPTFARAYAGLAMTYADDYRYQWSSDGAGALKRALELANTAREINADVREVHYALAYIHTLSHQPAQGIEHLKHAIDLDPSYADAYAYMGAVYSYSGQPARALPLLRYGMRLNPDAGYLYYMSLGEAYFFLGNNEQALLNLTEALARNPVNLETRVFLAATYAAAGNAEAAGWEAEEIRMLAPGFSLVAWLETSPLRDVIQKRRVIDLLRDNGL